MLDFFTYDLGDFPPGSGFGTFTVTHFAVLAVIALACVAMALLYRHWPEEKQRRCLKIMAVLILLLEAAKHVGILVMASGGYPLNQLPLQLCGLTEFVAVIHAFWPNRTTGEILYALGMPGAAAALIFPDWAAMPLINFFSLQSFIEHALLVCFTVMLLAGGQLRPSLKNIWRPAAFLAVTAPLMALLNRLWGTNYYFLNAGSPGSPLQFFIDHLNHPLFIVAFAGLVLGVWAVMYLPWTIADLHKKRRSSA